MSDLLTLADRVEASSGYDNALDVLCEIALFEPSGMELAIRANDAGTKVIVTYAGRRGERTFFARDYLLTRSSRKRTAAALRARAAIGTSAGTAETSQTAQGEARGPGPQSGIAQPQSPDREV